MPFKEIRTEEEYTQLVEEIKKHNRLYFEESKPLISDYEFDLLLKSLEAYEKKNPDKVSSDSPSQKIGETILKGFIQRPHKAPMLSLANTYSKEEIFQFMERVKRVLSVEKLFFCCELKLDGIALSLSYKNGKFVRALTRGDGKAGDDITENVRQIVSVPKVVDCKEDLEVRGEVFLKWETFHFLNAKREEQGLELWANPRNAAAGSLKLLDTKEVKRRKLEIACYSLVEGEKWVKGQHEISSFLRKKGFPVLEKKFFQRASSLEEIFSFIERVEKERSTLAFQIDGIVIKVDDLSFHKKLGATGKFPRFAVAYKYAPEQIETVIEDITVQVGRTGVLTPVAELKPVPLAGSVIKRATLHNVEEVERKDIRIQDTVLLEKGGDVIPKVIKVLLEKRKKGVKKWLFPKRCPICHSDVTREEGEVAIRCSNKKCGGQKLKKIIFFASKKGLDIEHLGEKVITRLFDLGMVRRFSDIFLLNESGLSQLEGFKEKSIHNLLSSIEKAKTTTLPRFLSALGISYVGEETAEVLASLGSLEKLSQATVEQLQELEGIGEKVAHAVALFFQEEENQKEIKLLLEQGILFSKISSQKEEHLFSGKTFVLTGTLSGYSREEASSLIRERGGKISSSVSNKTDYLLLGENPGSKYQKAKKLSTTILSEEQFISLL